jgi:hypothetical protein
MLAMLLATSVGWFMCFSDIKPRNPVLDTATKLGEKAARIANQARDEAIDAAIDAGDIERFLKLLPKDREMRNRLNSPLNFPLISLA